MGEGFVEDRVGIWGCSTVAKIVCNVIGMKGRRNSEFTLRVVTKQVSTILDQKN